LTARGAGSAGTSPAQTLGATPPPVGDLSAGPPPPRSRRPLVLALGAGVLVLGDAAGPDAPGAMPPLVDAGQAVDGQPPPDAGRARRSRGQAPGSGSGPAHRFVEKNLGGT
jgi:hypothetical protein